MAKNTAAPDPAKPAPPNRTPAPYHIMQAGEGTPWEDRGSIGPVAGFFKTCFQAMFAPGKLFHSMRRPETSGDAHVLVIIFAVLWGVSWVVHDLIWFNSPNSPTAQAGEGLVDYYHVLLVHFGLGAGGAYVLHLLVSRLFHKLVQTGDARHKTPPVLTYNVFAYAMGPTILCLIPFYIGPAIAVAWIFGLCVFGAISRLAIKAGGAVTCTLMAFGGLVGGAALAYNLIVWSLGGLSALFDFGS